MPTSDKKAFAGAVSSPRQNLLEKWIDGKAPHTQIISKRKTSGPAGLSFAQQRLWFLDNLFPGSAAYNLMFSLRLTGSLDAPALNRAVNTIVRRHEVLRARFAANSGDPCQIVESQLQLEVPIVDLQDVSSERLQERIAAVAIEEGQRPFDLTALPLFRVTLVRLHADDHILLIVAHHIIWDGRSAAVFFSEFARLYTAFREQKTVDLPELPIQYADFAEWQKAYVAGERLESLLAYWKKQLADHSHVVDLPTDRVRPAVSSHRGSNLFFSFGPAAYEATHRLCRELGTTPFMALLGAMNVWLSLYSGQEDIVVGCPIANRNRPELEQLIGFFANTLALRIDSGGNPSFRELLLRVRKTALEAYAQQDLPFEKLVEALQPKRDMSRNPLFQVMLNVAGRGDLGHYEPAGIRISQLDLPQSTSKVDLWLHVSDTGSEFHGVLEYDSDLFIHTTVQRMASRLVRILNESAAHPDRRVRDIPFLSEPEYRQLTYQWSRSEKKFDVEHCLHTLFEQQVRKQPYGHACIFESSTLTYGELEQRAGNVASHLRRLGVGPDAIVAIAALRSPEMIIGLLGILKAGGAYLPIDPNYPAAHISYILADSGAPIILLPSGLSGRLPSTPARELILEEIINAELPEGHRTSCSVDPDNLAYVIYTSGSTGRPKAAMNTHRGICNRLLWMQDAYRLNHEDRILQKTPFTFDVSVWEFFWPLLNGAAIVFARPEGHRDPAYLINLVRSANVTTIHFVPSLFQSFLAFQDVEKCVSLKRVISSGESLPPELVQRFFEIFTKADLYNLYGPTEAAVDVTAWKCSPGHNPNSVPIGSPISNIQAYILDRYMSPAPVGVPGELYIGGVGVGRGYLNRPDLTADRFVPDPFSGFVGVRLYRTGDRVKWLPEGSIEFIERMDDQVKVRGYRIELGEIECRLKEHPAIRDAAVSVREDGQDKQIVAYIIPRTFAAADAILPELRRSLKASLPDFMTPSRFVFLDALPLTSSGKLDRRNLPAPDTARPAVEAPLALPETPLQNLLAGIWMRHLRIERIGIDDNFFDLGGDSVRSLRIVAEAANVGAKISVAQLFAHQTIRELAHSVAMDGKAASEESRTATGQKQSGNSEEPDKETYDFPLAEINKAALVPLLDQSTEIDDVFPLIGLQEDFFAQYLAASDPSLNMVQKIQPIHGSIDLAVYQRSLELLAARHQIARTSFVWKGLKKPLQVIHQRAVLPVSYEDWRGCSQAEQEHRTKEFLKKDSERGMELAVPAPMRVFFAQIQDNDYLMFMSFNYMCFEGWSLNLLDQEQAEIYSALRQGKDFEGVSKPRCRDYIEWFLKHDFSEEEAFWRTELTAATMPTPLVETMRPGAQVGASGFDREDLTLEASLTQQIRDLARALRRTESIIFQAAWALILAGFSDTTEVIIGIAATGRSSGFPGIESLIAYVMNYIPLRIRLEHKLPLTEWLTQIQDAQGRALRYDYVPLKDLRAWCGMPPGKLLFESVFYFQNTLGPIFGQAVGSFYAKTAYPLRIDVIPQAPEIGTQIFASYHEKYFMRQDIRRILENFQFLLAEFTKDPSLTVGEFSELARNKIKEWI
jgi:amino acid adenylation domain-containing protein